MQEWPPQYPDQHRAADSGIVRLPGYRRIDYRCATIAIAVRLDRLNVTRSGAAPVVCP